MLKNKKPLRCICGHQPAIYRWTAGNNCFTAECTASRWGADCQVTHVEPFDTRIDYDDMVEIWNGFIRRLKKRRTETKDLDSDYSLEWDEPKGRKYPISEWLK